jgi:hypothetical protein
MTPEFANVEIAHSRNLDIDSFLVLGAETDFDSGHNG